MKAGVSPLDGRLGWAYLGTSLLAGGLLVSIVSGAFLGSWTSAIVAVILVMVGGGMALAAAHWAPGVIFALVPAVVMYNTSRGFFPFDLVVLGLTGYAILEALWHRDPRLPGPRALHLAFFGFILSGMMGLFLAHELIPFAGAMKRLVVAYCGAALVMRYADRERWPWFALSIPLAGTVFGLQVLYAYLTRGFVLQRAYELRGFYSNVGWGASNYVGAVLALHIIASVVILVLPGRLWLRVLSGLALIPMGLGLVMLVSRGALVAAALGLVALVATIGGRHRWKLLALAGLATVVVVQLPVFKVIWLRFTVASQGASYAARIALWKYALGRFLAHPVLGVGLGQGRFQTDDLLDNDPHNFPLSVASEMGVVGLVAWTALLVAYFRTPWVTARGNPQRAAWATSLHVLLVVAFVNSCYEPTFAGTHYFFLFFWVATIFYQATDSAVMMDRRPSAA